MIRTIIFDLGNVLLKFQPERLLMETFDNKSMRDEIMAAVFKSPEWLALDQGTINDEEALRAFISRCPLYEKEIRAIVGKWTMALSPINAHVEALETLKTAGYRLYILSNFHKTAYEEQRVKHPFFKLFDGGVISAYVHHLKPSAAIYEILLDKYHLEPNACLFLDDMKENIEAAEQLGIRGIWVTPDIDLMRELEKILGQIQ